MGEVDRCGDEDEDEDENELGFKGALYAADRLEKMFLAPTNAEALDSDEITPAAVASRVNSTKREITFSSSPNDLLLLGLI